MPAECDEMFLVKTASLHITILYHLTTNIFELLFRCFWVASGFPYPFSAEINYAKKQITKLIPRREKKLLHKNLSTLTPNIFKLIVMTIRAGCWQIKTQLFLALLFTKPLVFYSTLVTCNYMYSMCSISSH